MFLNQVIFNFWIVLIFSPLTRFSADNIYFQERYTVCFLKACKAINSLTCVSNSLLSDVYLNFIFNFKAGPLSDLSCLMSSMFVITLIIRIIKTTCFNNPILQRNLKESFLKVGGHFLHLTSPVPVTFTRSLACTFRKVWSTSALKSFCCRSYIFGIVTHLLMDKKFPFIGAQAHLQTQLLRTEWQKVLKITLCRKSPTK